MNKLNDKGNNSNYNYITYKGNYINIKRHGYWECYWDNGDIMYKGNYINGNKEGYWKYFRRNETLYRKSFYL